MIQSDPMLYSHLIWSYAMFLDCGCLLSSVSACDLCVFIPACKPSSLQDDNKDEVICSYSILSDHVLSYLYPNPSYPISS